jgi:predicted nucleic acid-binding protein
VGYLDASDQYHAWASQCFEELHGSLTTCEAVIAETEYLVPGSGPLLFDMCKRGVLQIVPLLPGEVPALSTLMKKYKSMQFADACIVRLSELIPDSVVYTTDKHDFSVYRRHRRAPIKCVTP